MRAGRLNKKVTIQQVTETQDGKGGIIPAWATFAPAWAAIEPLAGKEYLSSKQVNAETSVKIRIRYLANITSKMRVKYGTRIYEIVSPPIDVREGNREIHLMCKEQI
jgi:SPP1 family predicted phage head-tail adaptor